VADDGEVLGSVTDADAAVIFTERDVQHPMEGVFDPPVAADDPGERRSIGREAGEVVVGLN